MSNWTPQLFVCAPCLALAPSCQPFPELPELEATTATTMAATSASEGTSSVTATATSLGDTAAGSSSSESAGITASAETSERGSDESAAATSSGAMMDTGADATDVDVTGADATSSRGSSTSFHESTATAGASTAVGDTGSTSTESGATASATSDASDATTAADTGETAHSSGAEETSSCTNEEVRCDLDGRVRCEDGRFVPDPCPASTPACQDGECVLRGPAMVSAGEFLIDATEVTTAHYRAFLDARAGDLSGQPPECSWNTEFWDSANSMNPDDWPVTYVDWCDAWSFCHWAGKRLCGRIGGGPIARASVLDETQSQWFRSCGGPVGAGRPNPAAECNDDGNIAPVASYTTCEGHPAGLFDMVGNVEEWIDSCDSASGADDVCYVAGGSYLQYAWCDGSPFGTRRDRSVRPFGFRCCGE